jgi:riboflavin synthase
MFTGIIEELGKVQSIVKKTNLVVLTISAKKVLSGTKIGDSIAVDGACLTVVKKTKSSVTFDCMLETIEKTALARLQKDSQVNLERALKVSSRLDGHFVTGHVDDVVKVKKVVAKSNYIEIQFELTKSIKKYIAKKGSVTINGVSLTIGDVKKDYFSVYLIPHTLKVTNLKDVKAKSIVNVETDVLAKYILK